MVTTPLRTRSKGFIWFFSFLAWYFNVRSEGEKLILLLDEPGLSLHAKAQADLLQYFEKRVGSASPVGVHNAFAVYGGLCPI